MKVLFAHDHKFYMNENGDFFTDGKLPYQVWKRYLNFFDEIVITARARTMPSKELISKLDISSGPNVSLVPLKSLSSPVSMLINYSEAVSKITNLLKDCDALIARLPSEIGSIAINVAEKLGKPWAVEVVACHWDSLWNYGNLSGKIYAPFAMLKTRKLISKSNYSIYVTKEFLQKRYPSSGYTIGCSDVQIPFFEKDVLERRLEQIKSRQTFKIGLIGSLSSNYKGIATAINALSEIKKEIPDCTFEIVGGGDRKRWEKLAYRKKINNHVFFKGTITAGEQIFNWLDTVDLYIQPSKAEGLPRALVEAMSRGCPAIGSTAGGIPELLDSNNIHKPSDSQKLGQLIINAYSNKNWRTEQAIQNFINSQNFTIKALDSIRNDFWGNFKDAINK